MHELPVTERILDIALKHAEKNGATRIYSITLKVGGLTDLQDIRLCQTLDKIFIDFSVTSKV